MNDSYPEIATLYLYISGMTRIYKLMAYRTCYLVPVQNSTINQIDPQICNFTVGMAMGGMYDFTSFYLPMEPFKKYVTRSGRYRIATSLTLV